ncbi:hypothetical protein EZI54_06910 [Marinobacter halodurans]|uniref:Uncharacterized protein n=1 Tax=Marinobacter halodurans TaxID=2528979 RepID=A0ABY1ZRB7_9GAMM|nr:hypothetical protein [Marinobacter halodurans]TBW57381.1 hypothetical protein EZI54_06910 [Marinobacter halodurans]
MSEPNESSPHSAISKHNPNTSTAWGFLELLGIGVGAANLPLGLMMIVGSYVAQAVTYKQRQSEVVMPDSWLQQVSDSPEVSRKGLAHLAKCLDRKGFVSVKDAVVWAEIEKTEADKERRQKDRQGRLEGSGAAALLSRAQRDCSSLLGDINVDAALASVSDATRKTRELGARIAGSLRR